MTWLPKRAKTLIFLGVFAKITPKSPYYDPPFYGFFLECRPPCLLDPPTIRHGRVKRQINLRISTFEKSIIIINGRKVVVVVVEHCVTHGYEGWIQKQKENKKLYATLLSCMLLFHYWCVRKSSISSRLFNERILLSRIKNGKNIKTMHTYILLIIYFYNESLQIFFQDCLKEWMSN